MGWPLSQLGAIQLLCFFERPFALLVGGFEVEGALPFLEALLFGGAVHVKKILMASDNLSLTAFSHDFSYRATGLLPPFTQTF